MTGYLDEVIQDIILGSRALEINLSFIHMHMHSCGNPSCGQTLRFLRLLQSEVERKQQETVQSSRKAELETDTSALQLQHGLTQLWPPFT